MVKSTLQFVFIFIFFFSLTSQAQYNPQLLVPYKSDNSWGWSDTLGKVIVQPKYKESSFFMPLYKDRLLAKIGNETEGFQYVKPDGNLLFKSNLFHKSEDCSIKDLILLESKDGKKAIFSFESEKLVVPQGEDLVTIYFYGDTYFALFKKNSEKTFRILDNKRKILKTEIIEFEKVKINSCEVLILFKDSKGRFGKLKGSTLEYLSESEYAASRIIDDFLDGPPPFAEKMTICVSTLKKQERIDTFKSNIGKTPLEEMTYCNLKTSYFSVSENGKEGVFNDLGETVVPVIYDKVTFSINNQSVIIKSNGKYGFLKLPIQLPIIEPKYDSQFFLENTLYGENGEKFAVYKTYKGSNYIFVGQNGVEFFKD